MSHKVRVKIPTTATHVLVDLEKEVVTFTFSDKNVTPERISIRKTPVIDGRSFGRHPIDWAV